MAISSIQPAVTFSGVASGIDTEAVIEALVEFQARPIGLLERQRSDLEEARKIWSSLDEKVDGLESKLRGLRTESRLLANSTTVSDESVLTASASGTAAAGSYEILVERLARAGSMGSQTYADTDTLTVGTGTLRVTVGTTTTDVTIDSSSHTLDGVAQAINDADAGVTATVVATEPGGPYRLLVVGNETGADSAVSLDASGLSGGSQALVLSELQAAQDARLTVNGLAVERSSNTVTDVISGLTLSLVSAGTSTVTVTLDADQVKATLQEFVDAYNEVQEILREQLSYDGQSEAEAPPLLGDFSLRGIQRRLRSVVDALVDTGDGTKLNLSLLGIRTQEDGSLQIDAADLEEALQGDLESFASFFTLAGTGFAVQMQTVLDEVTDPVDGTIPGRQDAITARIDGINDRIELQEDRLDRYEERLRRKFAAFESLMGQLQAQQMYLAQQLLQNTTVR